MNPFFSLFPSHCPAVGYDDRHSWTLPWVSTAPSPALVRCPCRRCRRWKGGGRRSRRVRGIATLFQPLPVASGPPRRQLLGPCFLSAAHFFGRDCVLYLPTTTTTATPRYHRFVKNYPFLAAIKVCFYTFDGAGGGIQKLPARRLVNSNFGNSKQFPRSFDPVESPFIN